MLRNQHFTFEWLVRKPGSVCACNMNKHDTNSSGKHRNPQSPSDPSISVIKRSEKNSHFQLLSQWPVRGFISGKTVDKAHVFQPHSSHGCLSLQEQSWVNQEDSDGQQEESAESLTLLPISSQEIRLSVSELWGQGHACSSIMIASWWMFISESGFRQKHFCSTCFWVAK